MQRPLSGIRVIGFEQYMAGPYCTMLLADAGAEVIKIERPGTGDPRRSMPPFGEKDGHKKAAGFMGYNRNKKSLTLDFRTPEGKQIVESLVKKSDVLVENLRPGSLQRLKLGYPDLQVINPKLVYATISGFGRLPGYTGPYSDRPAFDVVAEAMSGIMHMVGFADKPPSGTIYGMADIYSGMVTAYGIMQALFMRERTGEGQMVDSSMYDNMLSLNESMIALHSVAGQSPIRDQPRNAYPRGTYQAKDGFISVNVPDERIWKRWCELMDRGDLIDDPRTSNGALRSQNRTYIDAVINKWLAEQGRDDVVNKLNDAGVPTGLVHTVEDIFACSQVEARGMLMPVNDKEVGEYKFARTPPHLSSVPELPKDPAPGLGENNREILEQLLGYESGQVDELIAQGVMSE
ncbi:CaiB/BaiF CoA transferase family protein [Pseudomonadota bacterium]